MKHRGKRDGRRFLPASKDSYYRKNGTIPSGKALPLFQILRTSFSFLPSSTTVMAMKKLKPASWLIIILVLLDTAHPGGIPTLLTEWGIRPVPAALSGTRTLSGTDVVVSDFEADHVVSAPFAGQRVVLDAIDVGYRLIDTATAYHNEEAVGAAVRRAIAELGLLSVLFFTFCYFRAIELMPLATAAILLYTSPIWVTLMAALCFHERLTARKLLALGLAFAGCVLVSGLSGGSLTFYGLLVGLGAGVGYALYSILGTVALRRYPPLTVTTWTFLFAAVGSWFLSNPVSLLTAMRAAPAGTLAWLIPGTAVLTAVIPYLAYTKGLQNTEAGRAAILATVEPVVATLMGALVFHETLSLTALLGIALVLGSIALLNTGGK